MTGQSLKHSAIEAFCQTGIGLLLAIVIQAWIAPIIFHYQITVPQAVGVTALFTVVSYMRQFGLRRFFVWWWGR